MTLHIHNTLTRAKEEFNPIDPANVRMYVCGPTVYDFAHLGNARPVVVFDTLYRLLQRLYPNCVTYVRNITDIDDKIMARAKESGEPIDTITTRTTQAFHDDMAALNARPPDVEPRATQYVGEMIAMIETLIKKKHAYAAEGHVLFNVPSMAEYGQLSRSTRDELVAGARVDVAPYKKDAADFVLWKPSTPEQVGWDSPWGRGRPGWHIECSAMAEKNLGTTFDIHGGGLDLRFPHHENEIAQSRCAHGTDMMAKVWMHNGFLMVNGEKMSKSLGNFYTVRDMLAVAPGEALRLALLSGHYRAPLDFSISALQQAKEKLDKWYGALRVVGHLPNTQTRPSADFESALLDDLNTSLAITHIDRLVKLVHAKRITEGHDAVRSELLSCANALGLLQQDPESWFKGQLANQSGLTDAEIDAQIAARLAARKAKNYAESDRIRDALAAQGVILEDSAGGTTWRRV
jgi:cysteinyl-tRNA synthetase